MDLKRIDVTGATVTFDLDDLATLAEVCTVARESLVSVEVEALARQAQAYRAAFLAMAIGGGGVTYMPPGAQASFLEALADRDLAGLVSYPGRT